MRWFKKLLFIGVSLFLVLVFFILGTETGGRLVIQGVCRLSGSILAIEQVEGRLIQSLKLKNVKISLPSAVTSVNEIDWSWQPSALINGQTRVAKLGINGVRTVLSENIKGPSSDDNTLPTVYFPVMLVIEQFVLYDLQLVNADGQVVFVLNSLQVGLEGKGNGLQLNDFALQTPDANFSLDGSIDMLKGWRVDILGSWGLSGFGFHRMDGTFSAIGPVTEPRLRIDIHSPGTIKLQGQLFDLANKPHWTVELDAVGVDLSSLILHCPQIELTKVHADLTGDFSSYQGNVTAVGRWQELTELELFTEIKGDGRGIDFGLLRINRPGGYAQSWEGKISWAEIFDWQGHFHFENFDLRKIDKRLQGMATADIVSIGKVVEGGVQSSFDIRSLKGVMHDHNFAVEGELVLDKTSVFTEKLLIQSDGIEGVAHMKNARFSWAALYEWSFQMQLEQFNPGFIHPFVSGNLSGEINGEGSFPETGPEAYLQFISLSGRLRGNEVFGKGELSYTAGSIESPGLELRSGDTVLTIDGKAQNDFALDFTLNSPDLGELIPNIYGEVSLQGNLSGNRDKPQVQAELIAKELVVEEQNLRTLVVQLGGDLTKSGSVAGQAVFEGLQVGSSEVKGTIGFDGSFSKQRITANLNAQDTAIEATATVAYGESWQGTFDRFSLSSQDYGNWKLRDEVDFSYGPDGGDISSFCLTDQGQLVCMGAQVTLTDTMDWQGQLSWKAIPMSLLYRAGVPSAPLAGFFEGEFSFSGQSMSIISANLQSVLVNPIIQFVGNEDQVVVIPLKVASLDSELVDQQMNSRISLTSSDSGKLELITTLTGISALDLPLSSYLEMPLKGRLFVDKFNSETFSGIADFLIEPKGPIDSDLSIEGTLGRPELYGAIALEQGGVTIPSQGVTLENLNVTLIARDKGARLICRAESGPGNIVVDGNVMHGEKGIEGDLRITGDNFLLVNLPEYVFRVSPQIRFNFGELRGEMKGRVKVPFGLITPEEMINSIKVSPDVVFVEGQEEIRGNGWPFYLDIDVEIGDEVSVDGYGLTGKLGGEMNLEISPDDFITGVGELQLKDGVFTIYGRSLDIERGLVKFTGGPIDNPGLDVRAQKTVSDKEAKGVGYTVGVDISGLTQDLKFQLFSDPYMDETEILSQMIIGRSVSGSSAEEGSMLQAATKTLGLAGGNAILKDLGKLLQIDDLHLEGSEKDEDVSLVLGKSLTKKLYIGYDINLFSELGQFRVRYDLTHGFWVETKSSSESTGADLLYTFEK